jgi:iron complex transport system substrate-binding protein
MLAMRLDVNDSSTWNGGVGVLREKRKEKRVRWFRLLPGYCTVWNKTASQQFSFLFSLVSFLWLALILLISSAACSKLPAPDNNPATRIITFAPSTTEIIIALGRAEDIVAADDWSLKIAGVPQNLPALNFFALDEEKLLALEPDVIFASGLSTAGSADDPFRLVASLGVKVVYIPNSLSVDGIAADVQRIADILGESEKGKQLAEQFIHDFNTICATVPPEKRGQKIYFEIYPAPMPITIGDPCFLDDMLTRLGCVNIFRDDGAIPYPAVETIIERNPDIIFTSMTPPDEAVAEIKKRPGFNLINAVENNRVYYIDTDSSSRPSPGVIKALSEMAESLTANHAKDANE